MNYNYAEIGNRIAKERKAAGYRSQDAFIEALAQKGYSISRNTLSAIECGKTSNYDVGLLFAMCELFNCELGYLLGEYAGRTGRKTDIMKETGLSENAVEKLQKKEYSYTISRLITHSKWDELIKEIYELQSAREVWERFASMIASGDKRQAVLDSVDDVRGILIESRWYVSNIFSTIIKDIENEQS